MTSHRAGGALAVLLSVSVLSGACASTGRRAGAGPVPRPFPGAPVPAGTTAAGDPSGAPLTHRPAAPGDVDGAALVGTALGFRGARYRNGGADPKRGFDCSGFTQYVFAQYGVQLPREVSDQYKVGATVDGQALQPGDLIFFSTVSPGASHVAIAIGGDQFVHAPSSRGVVRVERLSSPYWGTRFLGARRVSTH